MIKGIDHVAVAVENIDEALDIFAKVLGLEAEHREVIASYGVEVATIRLGNTAIELVCGTTPDSPISKYIARRGPGIHHIALETDDIQAELARVKENGADLIDVTPRDGKEQSRVAFIHPRSTGRILYELVQNRKR
ncbi:MAG TPA: methylmalonyl-CoA epimerase [Chromatiales bacterium]|nr:methylmalonyl-CoA epimerase [Chromatiales bacterium]